MWAVRDGNEPIVRRLLEGRADINLTNGDDATAMMLAIVNDRFDMAATLLELGADPKNDDSLYQAVEMHDATTDWRAKDGSRLRSDHPNKLTSLDLIKLLLDAGADPNKAFTGQLHSASMCCDTKGSGTPFYRAAVAADVEAMKLMIAHGADLEWAPKPAEAGAMGMRPARRRQRGQDAADGRDERRQGRRHGRRSRRHPRGHEAAVSRGLESRAGRRRQAAARSGRETRRGDAGGRFRSALGRVRRQAGDRPRARRGWRQSQSEGRQRQDRARRSSRVSRRGRRRSPPARRWASTSPRNRPRSRLCCASS